MIEFKLEVGKTYIDNNKSIGECVYLNKNHDYGLIIYSDDSYGIFAYNSGKYRDNNNTAIFLTQEYKEPKTVSGYMLVFNWDKSENITIDSIGSHLYNTKDEALEYAKSSRAIVGIVHLDNIEIEEV